MTKAHGNTQECLLRKMEKPNSEPQEVMSVEEGGVEGEKKVKKCGTTFISAVVVFLVALAWATSTQFSKTALNVDPQRFSAPYFLMWFATSFNMTCYPVFLIFAKIVRKQTFLEAHRGALTVFRDYGLSVRGLFFYVVPFVVLWVFANYSYAKALISINASMATAISSVNSAIVYVLTWIILKDKFYVGKLLAVAFAIAGVSVISLDGEIKTNPLGIALALFSACSAAVYKVCFKKVIGSPDLGQVSLFMSCVGVVNFFFNAIPAFVLIQTPYEWAHWDAIPWWPLIGSGGLNLLFNFFVNFGIALLNPLVITVGMLAGIPLNTAIDVLIRGIAISNSYILGTFFIICSCLLILIPPELYSLQRCRRSEQTAAAETVETTETSR